MKYAKKNNNNSKEDNRRHPPFLCYFFPWGGGHIYYYSSPRLCKEIEKYKDQLWKKNYLNNQIKNIEERRNRAFTFLIHFFLLLLLILLCFISSPNLWKETEKGEGKRHKNRKPNEYANKCIKEWWRELTTFLSKDLIIYLFLSTLYNSAPYV